MSDDVSSQSGLSVTKARPRLSEHQVQDLKRLGVIKEQIARLDDAIDLVSPLVSRRASLQDVRDELNALEQGLRLVQARLTRLVRGPKQTLAEVEVRERVDAAHLRTGVTDDSLAPVLAPLRVALQAVQSAQADLPTSQTRGVNAGDKTPVMWIHRALVKGWADAYDGRTGYSNLGRHLLARPPFSFNPSRSPRSKFRQIADICYGAMRDEYVGNAETAIKKYQAWRAGAGATIAISDQ